MYPTDKNPEAPNSEPLVITPGTVLSPMIPNETRTKNISPNSIINVAKARQEQMSLFIHGVINRTLDPSDWLLADFLGEQLTAHAMVDFFAFDKMLAPFKMAGVRLGLLEAPEKSLLDKLFLYELNSVKLFLDKMSAMSFSEILVSLRNVKLSDFNILTAMRSNMREEATQKAFIEQWHLETSQYKTIKNVKMEFRFFASYDRFVIAQQHLILANNDRTAERYVFLRRGSRANARKPRMTECMRRAAPFDFRPNFVAPGLFKSVPD